MIKSAALHQSFQRRKIFLALAAIGSGVVAIGCGGGGGSDNIVRDGSLSLNVDGLKSFIYPNNSGIITAMSISNSAVNQTIPYNYFFDQDGFLEQIDMVESGDTGVITRYSDRIEFRTYNPAGLFQSGFVIWIAGDRFFAGRLDAEEYLVLEDLLEVQDITVALDQSLAPYQRSSVASNDFSADKLFFSLIPVSSANALTLSSFGGTALNIAITVARGIFLAVAVPVAVGLAASFLLGTTPLVAATAALATFVLKANANASTNQDNIPNAPIRPQPIVLPSNVPVVLRRYSGSYSGTFSGGDSGSFSINISADGKISGFGNSLDESSSFSISGQLTRTGDLNLTAGSTSIGSNFRGRIDTRRTPWTLNGTWKNNSSSQSGSFTGSKR